VLLAQFVVTQGEDVRGTIGLVWAPGGNMQAIEQERNVAFHLRAPSVPGPGGLAIAGIAFVLGRPRRRTA
jgi:hypothetical protein